jgi:hypothetical protein
MPDQLDQFVSARPQDHPMIYAYSVNNPEYKGLLKVGFTAKDVEERVAQQFPVKQPDAVAPYKIVFAESAMYEDGGSFTDHDIHKMLKQKQVTGVGGEWFRCTPDDVRAAWVAVRSHTLNEENRTQNFKMRPEQEAAVNKTAAFYASEHAEGRIPKFLWNAKMRFGKTFTAYQLAKRMGYKRILILTFKPAVQTAWRDDLMSHVDFEGWQFISRPQNPSEPKLDEQYTACDKSRPIVCFGSFQDLLGVNENGGIKAQNEFIHTDNWDLVIFDEYHFGAWKDNAKRLFEEEDDEAEAIDPDSYDRGNAPDVTWLPITTDNYLYLSGTPFRALLYGEFDECQVFSWTYSDEQHAKETYVGDDNPYAALPKMIMLTYKIPDSIRRIAMQGEFNEFDLNVFFKAEGKGKNTKFIYQDYVQKWLDLIRGSYLETTADELKLGRGRPAMPFSDTRLLSVLSHTLWYLPNIASCQAMANLLHQKQNAFYNDYHVVVCAGADAGIGAIALNKVWEAMGDPLKTKSITLTCGKLTTGVTVKPWTGVFMLRNLKSPESYFQTAFRVQSPWEITTDDGKKQIMKQECYIFDFALDRALKEISDYSRQLNVQPISPERKIGDFINFLPVIAYDGSVMRQIDAGEILDIAMSGTSATLLARRWESALLVNVDNDTLTKLLANEEAMRALMSIEGFRSLNADIETIINKSNAVKKAKMEKDKLTPKEKQELTQEEKDYKSKRKEIQEKLIKFATRIPIFMYLTDYREQNLKDVITQFEPSLFKKVTGLDVKDFNLLCELNLFNAPLMDDAILRFRRYENASLVYTGLPSKHEGENVGLFDTILSAEDYYKTLYTSQQESLSGIGYDNSEMPDFSAAVSDDDEDDDEDEPEEPVVIKRRKTEDPLSIHKTTTAPLPNAAPVKPAAAPPEKPTAPDIDTLSIKVGTKLFHKAFGHGVVTQVDDASNKFPSVYVDFAGEIHKFQFPGAIVQGFLKIE